jgi:hypothetical protein
MSMWMLIVLGTAVGGAIVVWHNVSQTKFSSEEMLIRYRKTLEEARQKRIDELNEEAEAEEAADEESSNSRTRP